MNVILAPDEKKHTGNDRPVLRSKHLLGDKSISLRPRTGVRRKKNTIQIQSE